MKPKKELTGSLPDETGEIMILGYHEIDRPESQWCRTPENFRLDLQFLYENGYYIIPLLDYIHNKIKAPAGKTPAVITFDDSRPGQFQFLKKGGTFTIDPDCAIGVMEDMARTHPDFPVMATFFVNPRPDSFPNLFGQPELMVEKLKYLRDHGHEIGNHTYSHPSLNKCPDEEVQKELALACAAVDKYLPGYKLRTMALPYGRYPKNEILARTGSFEGITYEHEAVLYCGHGTAPAPGTKKFIPLHLMRIQAGDGYTRTERYFKLFNQKPTRRYISDGDPQTITVPKKNKNKLDYKTLSEKIIKIY
jgi:hypothetical protein